MKQTMSQTERKHFTNTQ